MKLDGMFEGKTLLKGYELEERMGLRPNTISNWIKRGSTIPNYHLPAYGRFFVLEEVMEWIQSTKKLGNLPAVKPAPKGKRDVEAAAYFNKGQ